MSPIFQKLLKRVTAKAAAKLLGYKKINAFLLEKQISANERIRRAIHIWQNWKPNQRRFAIEKFKSDAVADKTLFEYFLYINRRINAITQRILSGKLLTTLMKKFLKEYIDFFVYEKNYFKVVNSSWIKSASYSKSNKIMRVRMRRGKLDYPFYNVPIHVWVHLTTLPAHAGTYWWDKWLWQYSANKRWKK